MELPAARRVVFCGLGRSGKTTLIDWVVQWSQTFVAAAAEADGGGTEEDEEANTEGAAAAMAAMPRVPERTVGSRLRALADDSLVLVDTPPGSGPQVRQLLSLTQAMLGVLLPDTSSLVTVSTLERWLATYCLGRPDFITAACVINAVPDVDGLAAEVAEHLSNRLAAHMACLTIGHSRPLRESFAAAQRLSEYAPAAAVEADFRDLAQWLVTHI